MKFRKKFLPIVASFLLSVACFAACAEMEYVVSFNSDDGTEMVNVTSKSGSKISKPEDPVKAGFIFCGWFLDDELYNFDQAVTQNITLVARWQADTNGSIDSDTEDSTDNNEDSSGDNDSNLDDNFGNIEEIPEVPDNSDSNTPDNSEVDTPSDTPDNSETDTPLDTPNDSDTNTPEETPNDSEANTPEETPGETEPDLPLVDPDDAETVTPPNMPDLPESPDISEEPDEPDEDGPIAQPPVINYTLTALVLDTTDVKKLYAVGDSLSFNGLKVYACYTAEDGAETKREEIALNDERLQFTHTYAANTEGNYSITVTFADCEFTQEASYSVTVKNDEITSFTVKDGTFTQLKGDADSMTSTWEFTAVYAVNGEKTIALKDLVIGNEDNQYTLSSFVTNKTGTQTVTVTYYYALNEVLVSTSCDVDIIITALPETYSIDFGTQDALLTSDHNTVVNGTVNDGQEIIPDFVLAYNSLTYNADTEKASAKDVLGNNTLNGSITFKSGTGITIKVTEKTQVVLYIQATKSSSMLFISHYNYEVSGGELINEFVSLESGSNYVAVTLTLTDESAYTITSNATISVYGIYITTNPVD
jgi:uncharacterized repeat protein (TIGR02543 family)